MKKDLFQDDKLIFFDGAMGTMLQEAGWGDGTPPEVCNLLRPELVEAVHNSYVKAGADIITANTFGANALKLQPLGYSVEEVIKAGVTLAKKSAGKRSVALDVGPLGQLMAPMGALTFKDANSHFVRQMKAGRDAGADLILIETMSDLYEAKAAVLAAKEYTDLPIICSLTFQENGRTLMGNDPLTVVTVLEALGVDAIGVNCSLGPKELMPVIQQLAKYTHVPLLVQANAGLPELAHGKVTYPMTRDSFADSGEEMVQMGIKMLGGCCGTDPSFIKELRNRLHGRSWTRPNNPRVTAVASSRKTLLLNESFYLVGQRINPTGRPSLLQGLMQGDLDGLYEEALLQKQAGAEILDINVFTGQTNEEETMRNAVEYIQSMIPIPLQIDSADRNVLEAGARVVNGKPILNSVNASTASMDTVFPLGRKYGACIIGMTIDEKGIPNRAEGRLALAERLLAGAISYGIPKEDLIIDCVVESELLQPGGAEITLNALRLIKEKLGLKTILGISNISYGMKERESQNAAFLKMALEAGLDLAICDPISDQIIRLVQADSIRFR